MSKIALRLPIHHHWNNLYFQNFTGPDRSYPLPFWYSIKQDQYTARVLKGYYNSSCGKIELQKRREGINIYITHNSTIKVNNLIDMRGPSSGKIVLSPTIVNNGVGHKDVAPQINPNLTRVGPTLSSRKQKWSVRPILSLLKNRISIYNLYTFPIHEGELLIKYLLNDVARDGKGNKGIKERLNNLQKLLKLGLIKGIKFKIQGRYKKSTRTQNEIYQFGQIPNTPTTNLSIKLYYTSTILLQSLGSSSLHLYIIYNHLETTRGLSGKI